MDPPTPPRTHPIDVVPPPTLASPADVGDAGPDVPFWRPTWRDAARHLGWRWVLFLPAVGVGGLLASFPWWPRGAWWPVLGQLKLLLWAGGLAVVAAGAAVKSTIARRTDPFCIHCGYDLTGLPDGHACPECGRPFTLAAIAEYRRDPAWFAQRVRARTPTPMTSITAGPVRRKRSRDGT